MTSSVMKTFLVALLLTSPHRAVSAEPSQTLTHFYTKSQIAILSNTTITEHPVRSEIACVRQCRRTSGCVSANFDSEFLTCEVNMDNEALSANTIDTSSVRKHTVLILVPGPAAEMILSVESCGPPDVQQNALISTAYNGTQVGDTTSYTCVHGYQSATPVELWTCTQTLTWELTSNQINCVPIDPCDLVPVELRVNCGWPGCGFGVCSARGCCYDTELNNTCFSPHVQASFTEKTLTFYSSSFCDVYAGGERVHYDRDYSADVITIAANIRLLIFFFDASAGIRARLSDGRQIDESIYCKMAEAGTTYDTLTPDHEWFSDSLNETNWEQAIILDKAGENVDGVPEILHTTVSVTAADREGAQYIFCRWWI